MIKKRINLNSLTNFSRFTSLAVVSLFAVPSVHAATLTWDIAGPSDLWTSATGNANWLVGPVDWTDGNAAVFNAATGEAITITGIVSPTSVAVGANNGSWSFAGTGGIGGGSTLTKSGTGTLTISTANSYSGLTNVQTAGGVLNIQNALALGNTAGATNVNAGSLQLQGGITVAGESLTVTNGGRLANFSGNNEWTGSVSAVTSGSGSRFQSDSGTLAISGTVTLTGNASSFSVRGVSDGVVSGNIVEGGTSSGLSKADAGTWTFSGNNSYLGTTTVGGGTLLINGNSSGATGAVAVNVGTLGGNGTIGGDVTVANVATAILAPGTSSDATATLALNNKNLTFAGTASQLKLDIAGTAAGSFDQIVGINALAANGDIVFTLSGTYGTASWNVLDFAGVSGNFDTVTLAGSYAGSLTRLSNTWTGTVGGLAWTFEQTTGVLSAVPEPSTYAMFLTGVFALVLLRKRKAE